MKQCNPSSSRTMPRAALPSVVPGASPPVHLDRRGMLLSLGTLLCSAAAPCSRAQARLELPNKEVDNDTSPVIQEMLRRTAEKKEERYKQRLNDYYRRNFREYLEFDAGDPRLAERRGIKPETQAAINKWLEENK